MASGPVAPVRHSGFQERLENLVNQSVWRARQEGRVDQVGSPAEVYGSPATPFVARFVGQ